MELRDRLVLRLPGDLEAPLVLDLVGLHRPELLVHRAAERRAGVATDAVDLDEELEPPQRVRVQRGHVPGQELVEGRRRHQPALEGRDRLRDRGRRDRVGLRGVRRLEPIDVARDRLHHRDDRRVVGERHLDRVLHRHQRLLLDVRRAPVPELREVGRRVEHRRRVAIPALALVTRRGRLAVDPELVQLVAGVARDIVVLRQPRVVVELPPQRDLLRRDRVLRRGPLGRDRREVLLARVEQLRRRGHRPAHLLLGLASLALDLGLGGAGLLVGVLAAARGEGGAHGERAGAQDDERTLDGCHEACDHTAP